MRKDVKVVVAAASLLLVGLLGYVLFAPSHKAVEVTDESLTAETGAEATAPAAKPDAQHEQPAPVVNVTLPPATEPAVTVAIGSATTQPSSVSVLPVVPAVDSNVALGTTPAASTDWDKTLNTGAVAMATGTHAALPSNTLIAATDAPAGAWTTGLPAATPSTRPSVADAVTPSSAAGAKKHKVVYGETLSSISAEYYGNNTSYNKIIAANPGVNPNRLKVGTILTIPDIKGSKGGASGMSTPSPAAEKAAPGTTYAVKSGDSLQKIATKLYGSSDKWQKIYELNRSSIGGDPHRLRAGMVLKLPTAPTASAR